LGVGVKLLGLPLFSLGTGYAVPERAVVEALEVADQDHYKHNHCQGRVEVRVLVAIVNEPRVLPEVYDVASDELADKEGIQELVLDCVVFFYFPFDASHIYLVPHPPAVFWVSLEHVAEFLHRE